MSYPRFFTDQPSTAALLEAYAKQSRGSAGFATLHVERADGLWWQFTVSADGLACCVVRRRENGPDLAWDLVQDVGSRAARLPGSDLVHRIKDKQRRKRSGAAWAPLDEANLVRAQQELGTLIASLR